MILQNLTWQEVDALSREIVVVIPTGAVEQHGTHLPLVTDSLIAGRIAEEAEKRHSKDVLLTPCLWLGASAHHLGYSGTLSADFPTYQGAIKSVIESLVPHGFRKFVVVNGHGGNIDPIGVALRELKHTREELLLCNFCYFLQIQEQLAAILDGPDKGMHHADEAEASLVLHLSPQLVKKDKLRDDGLKPPVAGMVHNFKELSEEGSIGYASLATAEKGIRIFEAAVSALETTILALASGYRLTAYPAK
ncbi:MAG: creatininase family protein [Armatimonadetes bacterium]|nr:creatininase family protein [Armatimonadota bacterium]